MNRLPQHQTAAAADLLEGLLDPVSRAIAKAPIDDEPETEAERRAVAESDEWFKQHPGGIPFEEVLAEFGFTLEDVKNYRLNEED